MAGNTGKVFVGVGIGVVVLYLLFQSGYLTPGTTTPTIPTGSQPVPPTQQCAYAPTVQLGANNKYDAGQTNWGNWKYKLNGGTTTTDADGSFEVAKGDVLQVLVADANGSAYYKSKWDLNIVNCGTQPLTYNNVVAWSQYEVKCFNQDGDPINSSTYANNLSIGSGGTRSIECRLESLADKGMPYGGVMVLELNSTTYEENLLAVTWEGASLSSTTTPSKYTVGATTATTKSFSVPAFEDAKTIVFFINNIKAESGQNPGASGGSTITEYGDDIVGFIYPINCYEEEDVTPSEFRCGLEDKDNTFTSPGGTGKEGAEVARVIIPVS